MVADELLKRIRWMPWVTNKMVHLGYRPQRSHIAIVGKSRQKLQREIYLIARLNTPVCLKVADVARRLINCDNWVGFRNYFQGTHRIPRQSRDG